MYRVPSAAQVQSAEHQPVLDRVEGAQPLLVQRGERVPLALRRRGPTDAHPAHAGQLLRVPCTLRVQRRIRRVDARLVRERLAAAHGSLRGISVRGEERRTLASQHVHRGVRSRGLARLASTACSRSPAPARRASARTWSARAARTSARSATTCSRAATAATSAASRRRERGPGAGGDGRGRRRIPGDPARACPQPAGGRGRARRRAGRRREDDRGPACGRRLLVRAGARRPGDRLAEAALAARGVPAVDAGRRDRVCGHRLRAGHDHAVRIQPDVAGRSRTPP